MALFVTLRAVSQSNIKEFVQFWSSFYDYKKENLYEGNILRNQFTAKNIHELFEWKNNMPLSGKKQGTVSKIKRKIKIVNGLKKEFDEALFKSHFGKISLIWRIFLKHIIAPKRFPLYDQHIHRAYFYLQTGKVANQKLSIGERLKFYEGKYIDFFETLCSKGRIKNRKKADDALWSFGKFLSRYPDMLSISH
jgi:hypothetical protein